MTQVLVDEATDFSPVQLACMHALSRPEFDSFFLAGDTRQRLTTFGTGDLDLLPWVSPDFEVQNISIGYRHSRPLAKLAEALAILGGGASARIDYPAHMEDANIPPLLAEHTAGGALATWLCDRIAEVERALGALPSVAIFVDGDDRIDPVVAALRPLLRERNVDVVGCKEGRVVGTETQVRVFDVGHIKGLEFEAVFFVGIDALARRLPDLFDKYLYVGVSRAATYLGITCEGALPDRLEPLREQVRAGNWAQC